MSEQLDLKSHRKFYAWMRIARIQFYPMTFIAYSLGAACAFTVFHRFDIAIFLAGYSALFLIELCAILANEYYDYDTDRINKNFSAFTGGSRALVEGRLGFREIKTGISIALCLIIASGYLLIKIDRYAAPGLIIFLLLTGIFLGLGYTVRPLKFCYRGLGEIVVGITHSPYVILCGFIFQAGTWRNPLPWLLSGPLFFAVLAAIILADIPDFPADKEVSKRTIAVIFGPRFTAIAAMCLICIAAVCGILLLRFKIIKDSPALLIMIIIPHAIILLSMLAGLIRSNNFNRRIDNIMAMALSYIAWFGLIPLASLLLAKKI